MLLDGEVSFGSHRRSCWFRLGCFLVCCLVRLEKPDLLILSCLGLFSRYCILNLSCAGESYMGFVFSLVLVRFGQRCLSYLPHHPITTVSLRLARLACLVSLERSRLRFPVIFMIA